jgi:hypothetical protein
MFCLKLKIYVKGISSAVLYGCETWSFTLREEHTLRVFENGVLGNVSQPEREGVTGDWWKIA